MKILLSVAFSLLAFFTASAQFETAKQTYKSKSLDKLVSQAKTVAILPFNVRINYKKMPKGTTLDMVKNEEDGYRYQMQEGMYTYLLRKADSYSVSFQDVSRTNALLKKAGVTDVNELTADSICSILGVDAVLKCNWSYEKTGSEAGAIATTLLLGVARSTASGSLVLQLYGADDGELAWRFYKEMNEGAFSSAGELMERMMRKIGRNFPFEK